MIFGSRAVLEALKAGKEIERLYINAGPPSDTVKEVMDTATRSGVKISKVPMERLNRFTMKNHQGVVCFLSPIVYASLDHVIDQVWQRGEMPFVLVLDRITDVRNFGAITRSAEGAGVHCIVIPEKESAIINSDAMKTSAGALNHIPVCRVPRLKEAVTYLKESGIATIGCTEKAVTNFYVGELSGPVALIMGSEEDGISPDILRICDQLVKIPMYGKVDSLNVSVATALVLFEVVRQRHHTASSAAS